MSGTSVTTLMTVVIWRHSVAPRLPSQVPLTIRGTRVWCRPTGARPCSVSSGPGLKTSITTCALITTHALVGRRPTRGRPCSLPREPWLETSIPPDARFESLTETETVALWRPQVHPNDRHPAIRQHRFFLPSLLPVLTLFSATSLLFRASWSGISGGGRGVTRLSTIRGLLFHWQATGRHHPFAHRPGTSSQLQWSYCHLRWTPHGDHRLQILRGLPRYHCS